MSKVIRTIVISLQFILAAAVLAVVYGFIVSGGFTLIYVFNACFLTGAVIIFTGLLVKLLPVIFKFDKLTDHTTYGERFADQFIERQKKGNGFLFLGISVIIITGVIQLVLAAII